jgi:hypothetical protein
VIPIPTILKEIAESSKFIDVAGEYSVKTELLPLLLNMHDYNYQNGTHCPLFEIAEVFQTSSHQIYLNNQVDWPPLII